MGLKSLYNICNSNAVNQHAACRATADVYYWAVRALGRVAASNAKASLDADALRALADALSTFNAMVEEAKANGELQ